MNRNNYNYKEMIQALNNIKKATELKHKEFSLKELNTILIGIGLTKHNALIQAAINTGLFIRISKGKYSFANLEVIPIQLLKATINNYRVLRKRYNQNNKNKSKDVKYAEDSSNIEISTCNQKENPAEIETIEETKAIDLLKSLGYKVCKKVIEYKEI